jgi:hypothetical protein
VSSGVDGRRQVVPADLRALAGVRADYCDLFTADASAAPELSPEQWARAAVEQASPAGRFLAWRMLCHLRLAKEPSSAHIGGWRISARGDDWIRLEASSWFMTANMVFKAAHGRLLFATFVQYDAAVARAIWTAVSAGHRAVAPDFLSGAVRRATHAPPGADGAGAT